MNDDDDSWIDDAVSRFEGSLTRYASRLLNDHDRARDVVQEAFLKLCGSRRKRVEPILAEWLFTVCRNAALDVLKKEKRMSTLNHVQISTQTSVDPPPGERIEREETAASILAALESLPENRREAIRLKFQNGFSYEEIARITGKSVSHVGVLIHEGLKTLRAELNRTESHHKNV